MQQLQSMLLPSTPLCAQRAVAQQRATTAP